MPFKFAIWHYSGGIIKFFEVWKNFIGFFWRYFSVSRLFLTLFSPWKRDISRSMARGLHPLIWARNLIENMMSRIIGLIIRTMVVIFAIILEISTILVGTMLLLYWIFSPLILLAGIFGFYFYMTKGVGYLLYGISFSAFGIVILILSFNSFRDSKKDYFSDLPKQKWFRRFSARIGEDAENINIGIFEDKKALENFLQKTELTADEFDKILNWEKNDYIEKEKKGKFWLKENLYSHMPIGRQWSFAYTVDLDKHSTDLTKTDCEKYMKFKLAGKDRELQEMKLLLSRSSQNNVILIGEAGVGRHTIVYTLAKEISDMKAGNEFNDKRVLEIDLSEAISNAKGKNEVEGILRELFGESAYAGNIILFIKDIHNYLKNDPQSEGEDISEILSQFLPYPNFQFIGTTTPSEFHANVEKKEEVMKYCDKIMIGEANEIDTMEVLLHKLKTQESKNITFTYQALRELIELSKRYITTAPFPEKALDIMEEVLIYWSNNSSSPVITPEVVNEAVSKKIGVPLGDISKGESEKLLDLENVMHKRVIGQDFAVKQIAETMRRARVGMANDKKPLGSFIFLGPTGVGKTESAKALAEAYFGDENRMIRLDMSEYQNQESMDRLIGSSNLEKEGYLVTKVKENPYSLLLLDEIEKADPDILNLFLQILDEGNVTDVFGKKVSFRNLIIIATSNAGSDVIRQAVIENLTAEEIQKKIIDYTIKNGIFRPEFLNRFEGVIFFNPLGKEEVIKITEIMLRKYSEKLKANENIKVEFDPQIIQEVSEKAFDQTFGARNIDRFIQDKIEDKIVKKMISGEIKKGDSFIFKKEDIDVS